MTRRRGRDQNAPVVLVTAAMELREMEQFSTYILTFTYLYLRTATAHSVVDILVLCTCGWCSDELLYELRPEQ